MSRPNKQISQQRQPEGAANKTKKEVKEDEKI